MILDRLQTAYSVARQTLLDERQDCPYWEGELSASALSTATAISALALYERGAETAGSHRQETMLVEPERCQSLIDDGTGWLRDHQNEDGGWGDTDKSYSNVATTYLVMAAFHLAGQAPVAADQLARADSYLETQGRFSGLRKRYGKDKSFVVPILTNLALAGLIPWKEISALPFELAWLPC